VTVGQAADERPATETGRLGELYREHAEAALRLAYLLTGEQALAEDLVQEAFVRVAGRFMHLRDPDAFGAYLRRAVVNLTNSHYRRRRVERAYLTRAQADAAIRSGGGPAGTTVEDRDALWNALGRLPQRQRAAIVLRYYEDLSESETAAALGCSVGTVKSQTFKALAKLRASTQLADGNGRRGHQEEQWIG
jgi:RNA polymerase sigma-70 factor (sigma-E family)